MDITSMTMITDPASARSAITYAAEIIRTLTALHEEEATAHVDHHQHHDSHHQHHHQSEHSPRPQPLLASPHDHRNLNLLSLYTSHRVCFNTFLHAALGMLVIATQRAGAGGAGSAALAESCRGPMRMALDLLLVTSGVEGVEAEVAKRVGDTLKRLRVAMPAGMDVREVLRGV